MPKHNLRDNKGRFAKAEAMVEQAYGNYDHVYAPEDTEQPPPTWWERTRRFFRSLFGRIEDDNPFGSY